MKSSASFRLHAKPSITKSPSQESKNDSICSHGSQSETSKEASRSTTSSCTSSEFSLPLPKELLQQPLEDFDLPNKNVSLTTASVISKAEIPQISLF